MDTFDQMEATLLLCPKCGEATPVRKRLLLVLPEGEKFDYVCTRCGSVAGDKIERPAPGALPADTLVTGPYRRR